MAWRECRHIKSNGGKCHAASLSGKPYCYFHMRLHCAAHAPKSGLDAALELPAIEDRRGIHIALNHVLHDLAANRLDVRRASKLLYGLQIFSHIVREPRYILEENSIQNLTKGPDGDDMAPQEYGCKDKDDCNDCPYSDGCTHWTEVEDSDEADDEADKDVKEEHMPVIDNDILISEIRSLIT